MTRTFLIVVWSIFLSLVPSAFGAETKLQSYSVSTRHRIQMEVPVTWEATTEKKYPGLPLTVVLKPVSGQAFEVLLTTFNEENGKKLPEGEGLKRSVQCVQGGRSYLFLY